MIVLLLIFIQWDTCQLRFGIMDHLKDHHLKGMNYHWTELGIILSYQILSHLFQFLMYCLITACTHLTRAHSEYNF